MEGTTHETLRHTVPLRTPQSLAAESAALSYLACGLSVFPANADRTPAVKKWGPFKDTLPTSDGLRSLYSAGPVATAIVCGIVSRNLECLDVDEKHNNEPTSLLDKLRPLVDAQASGLLDRLVHESTQSAGHHFVYRCPSVSGSKKLAMREPTADELIQNPDTESVTLIETRGEGGYFICAPSPGYTLVNGTFTAIPEITEQERSLLHDCCRALGLPCEDQPRVTGYEKRKISRISKPGDDFNFRGDIRPLLQQSGWQKAYSQGQVEYWRRPGKATGISASLNYHDGLLHVFSTSANPPGDAWYTKFAVYALLKHAGDFEAAADDLADQGYGGNPLIHASIFLGRNYEFRVNAVTEKVEYRRKASPSFTEVTDYGINSLLRELSANRISLSIDTLARLLNSDFSPRYDPFLTYFRELPAWNANRDYIDELARTITMKNPNEHQPFTDNLRKWLVAAVGCAIDPSVVNHHAIILVGPQGKYKTTWLNRLVPGKLDQYKFVGTVNPENKDTLIFLSTCFLINLDELETLTKHDLGTLKSQMTLRDIKIRKPYDRFDQNLVRRASFVGSINRGDFLNDETGSRRFLAFEIEQIDLSRVIDMDMVYSQAYALFRAGFTYWFDGDAVQEINDRNRQFQIRSTEDEMILRHFDPAEIGSDGKIKQPATGEALWLTATEAAIRIAAIDSYNLRATSARDFGAALTRARFISRKRAGEKRYAVSLKDVHPPSVDGPFHLPPDVGVSDFGDAASPCPSVALDSSSPREVGRKLGEAPPTSKTSNVYDDICEEGGWGV